MRFIRILGYREETFLILIAVLVGAFSGLGAVVFGGMVRWADHFFFATLATQWELLGSRMYFLPLIPAAGALVAGVGLTYLVPEAKGPGVPAVVYALTKKGGIIRFRVAVGKAIGSALTIGSGGSAGTEAPIIHIGATLGSTVGQWLRLPPQYMPIIVASGAAAGLSAIFNAPIAGVLFALEIFLQDINYKTFTPVVIASVTAATLARALTHKSIAMFAIPPELITYHYEWYELIHFAVLGGLCGIVAVGFIRMYCRIERLFQSPRLPMALRPAVGALLMGLLGVLMLMVIQQPGYQPAVFGNGYQWIQSLLKPESYRSMVDGYQIIGKYLLLLFALKLLATCFTLGSGGSGGEFGPALFLGAALGGTLTLLLSKIGFQTLSAPTNYAIVGMAGLIAGTTHAPLMAILLLFEITGNYTIILPIMIAAVLSTTFAQLIEPNSFYSVHLRSMGIRLGGLADLTILRKIAVNQIPLKESPQVFPEEPLASLVEKAKGYSAADFVVVDHEGRYLGMVVGRDFRAALLYRDAIPLMVVDELIRPCSSLSPRDTLETALNLFTKHEVDSLPVVVQKGGRTKVLGLVTHNNLMKVYQRTMEKMKH